MKKEYLISNISNKGFYMQLESLLQKENLNYSVYINNIKNIISVEGEEELIDEDIEKIASVIRYISADIEFKEFKQEKVYRRVLLLNHLDCANCAAKIERISKRTFNYEFISVDFATARFIIETKDKDLFDNIIERLTSITKTVDDNIVVSAKELANENKISNDDEDEEKINKITFIIGAVLFAISIILHYLVFNFVYDGYILDNINENFDTYPLTAFILIPLCLISYILLGGDVLLGALRNIKGGRVFDEKFLMSIATLFAFLVHSYIEAIAVMIFYKVGELLQEIAVNKSRKSIAALIDIKPQNARLFINDTEIDVDPSELAVGDKIIVKAGEKVPVDGIVLEGEANLDTSALTGESKYFEASVGNEVISGSVDMDGMLLIEVKKKFKDSMVSKILDLVQNANVNKAKTEKFVTKFAKYYTPIICALSVLIATIFFIIGRSVHDSIYPAMVFLVVSCPCALVISVPLGYFGAIGGASKQGILIKGSNYLDTLGKTGVVVFDKTGTLTKGKFEIKKIVSVNEDYLEEDILRIAANCECVSNHPIAKSIVSSYGKENIDVKLNEPIEITKKGIIVKHNSVEYYLGNSTFMNDNRIKIKDVETSGSIIYLGVLGKMIGYIELGDEIRPEAKDAINELKEKGLKVVMLTGDNEASAKEVANALGIDTYYFNLSPVEKVKRLRKLKKEYNKNCIFIGDGVNDAPVLTNADIGIAMGGLGSDAAIEVSDVVLMTDDISKVPMLLKIANKTQLVIYENIIFALAIKFLVLFLTVIDRAGLVRMWAAVFADVGVALIAIINSLRAASVGEQNHILFKKRSK